MFHTVTITLILGHSLLNHVIDEKRLLQCHIIDLGELADWLVIDDLTLTVLDDGADLE